MTWTAPETDAGARVQSYDVRYSTGADIQSDTDFDRATPYPQNWAPANPWATEQKSLTGLIPDTTHYFSIRAHDGGAWAEFSSTGTNCAQPNGFYCGWDSPGAFNTFSIALGDYDGDGDLDQLAGNFNQNNQLYRNEGAGIFLQVWTAAVAVTNAVSFVDYDNDGDLDHFVGAVRNQLYRNDAGSFTKIWEAGESYSTSGIAFGDFDSDGDLDQLGATNIKNRLYRNDRGNFVKVWESDEPFSTYCVASGDYDNDGDLDHLTGTYNSTKNQLYRNDGGNFVKIWNSYEADNTYAIAFGDFDSDGDLDQLTGNGTAISPQKNRLYRNDGGNFVKLWDSAESGATFSISLGDFDNDGDLDHLTGNVAQNNRIYRNDDGNFNKEWDSDESDQTRSIVLGDIDGDGDLDQLAGNNGKKNRIYISEYALRKENTAPDAPSAFTSKFDYSIAKSTLTFKWDPGEYDAGNSPNSLYYQIAVATQPITLHDSDQTRITTPSTFTVSGVFGSPLLGNYLRPALKTWSGDASAKHGIQLAGAPVLSNTTYYWRIQTIDSSLARSSWSAQQYAGYFIPATITDLTAMTTTAAQVRLSWTAPSDGAGGTCTQYLIKYSTETDILDDTGFSAAAIFAQNWPPGAPGQPESYLLTGLIPETTYWFSVKAYNGTAWSSVSSTGTNHFQPSFFWRSWSSDETISTHVLGDYDNDGNLDLMAAGGFGQPNVLYRNEDGHFTGTWDSGETLDTQRIAFGDYDNDGDLDQLLGSFTNPNTLYRNDGAAGFSAAWSASETVWTSGIASGDGDNDGDLDFLVANGSVGNPNLLYRNDRSGQFIKTWDSGQGYDTMDIAFGDYDNDGDLDHFTTGSGDGCRVFRNDGGKFNQAWVMATPETDQPISVLPGDFDNDGDLDLVMPGEVQDIMYRHDVGDNFIRIWQATESDSNSFGALGDFDSDGYLDYLSYDSIGDILYRGDGETHLTSLWQSQEPSTSGIACGDIDNDGDLDYVASKSGGETGIYLSEYALKKVNDPPDAPSIFASKFSYSIAGSTLTFMWNPGQHDAGNPTFSLYYQIAVSTQQITAEGNRIISPSTFTVSGVCGSPLLGNYVRAPLRSWHQGESPRHGLQITGPPVQLNTTYYWMVQTIDAGLARSDWSAQQEAAFFPVPATITDLTPKATTFAQVELSLDRSCKRPWRSLRHVFHQILD